MEENQCAEGSGLVCDYNWLGSYLEGGKDIGDIPRAKLPLGSVQRTRREVRGRGKNPCLLMRGKSIFWPLGRTSYYWWACASCSHWCQQRGRAFCLALERRPGRSEEMSRIIGGGRRVMCGLGNGRTAPRRIRPSSDERRPRSTVREFLRQMWK